MSIQTLREKRQAALAKMQQLRDKIKTESRDFTVEERAAWDACNADFDSLGRQIDVLERADVAERLMAAAKEGAKPGNEDVIPGAKRKDRPRGAERVKLVNEARSAWFAHKGGHKLTRSQVEACKALGANPKRDYIDFPSFGQIQKRDLSVVTNTAGEHTIAEGFVYQLEKSLLAHGRVRMVADVMTTAQGNPLPWPTVADHQNAAELLAENTAVGEADPTFGTITFGAYKLSSKMVQVPNELMQDSAFDIASLLGTLLGERLARTENTYFTTGTGSQPNGIITGASSGKTTASATAITMDEVIDLIHSVDPAYRADPSMAIMAHDNIWAYIRKLKDSSGMYLWQPPVQAGQPGTIFGYPTYTNQQMASAVTTGLKTILAGAMKKFKIRDAGGVRLVRLNERFAEADQTAFIAFERVDSKVLDAGTDPLKYLTQA